MSALPSGGESQSATSPHVEGNDELAPLQTLQRSHDALEQRLAKSAAKLQVSLNENRRLITIANSAASGILLCDPRQPDSPIDFVNDAFCKITGYPRQEIIGNNCRFLQGPDTDHTMIAQMGLAQAERRSFRGTLLNYRKDGTAFWNGLTIDPVFDDDSGELICFVGLQVDMTVRVEELERVRRSEARLSLAQRVARLGSWEQTSPNVAEPTTVPLNWSEETFRIFGYTPETSVDAWSFFEKGVHPDDLATVYTAYTEALRTGQGYSLDHRIVRPDGSERVVHEEADFIRDPANGRLVQVVGTIQDITERTRAEMTAMHLAAIVESSEDAIISKTPEGIITSWNKAAETVYGYTQAEAIGQRCLRLLIPPDRQNEAAGVLHKLSCGEHIPPFESVRLRKGGLPFDVSLSMSPIINAAGTVVAVSSISRDISERKQAELARARLAAIVESSADAIVGQDLQGIVTSWNAGAERIFGYSASEMLHRSMLPVIPPARQQEEVHFLACVQRGERLSNFDTVRRTKGGAMIDVSISVSPIMDAAGNIVGVSKIVRETTERKQAETDRHAKDKAERANVAKSEFLSRMSHELRTPLNAILGFGQLLEFSPLAEHDKESVQYILKGGRHLLSLVEEVLDLARVEAREVRLAFGAVLLDKLAHECTSMLAQAAEARAVTCNLVISPACQLSVWADEQRLRQILLNLLSNAIKYNREGGKVTLSCAQTETGAARLSVRDNGPGISAEELARLFMPFERLGQEHGKIEGTGLGLAISKKLAEAMGGRLGVESELGKGSTFWIELPTAPNIVAADVTKTGSTYPPDIAPEKTPAARLLYIEDNLSNLQVVEMVVARLRPRWQFLSTKDGERGLQEARAHLPDIILLDLQLPGINGDAVLLELRTDPLIFHIPVLLLSADAKTMTRERLQALGANDFLSKPFSIDDLLEKLDDLLENSGR